MPVPWKHRRLQLWGFLIEKSLLIYPDQWYNIPKCWCMDVFAFWNVDLSTFLFSEMLMMKNVVIKNVTKLFLIKILFGNRRHFMLKRKVMHYIRKWVDSKNKKCLVIQGARQTGKTYIAVSYTHLGFIWDWAKSSIYKGWSWLDE